MGTKSRVRNHSGYCKVDGQSAVIGIQYTSNPLTGNRFKKTRNRCPYLNDGKCNLGNECTIFKDAPEYVEVNPRDTIDKY